MPISSIEGLDEKHWSDVKAVLEEAILDAGFTPRLVSDAPDVGVIQTRIIGNIYNDEIVVCDVSARNPNVLFELGMRVAFDKPVIIVKDDETNYAFDVGPIEHVLYPRNLRYADINKFKRSLSEKIKSTHANGEKSSILKEIGPIKVPQLETTAISGQDLIWEELRSIRSLVQSRNSPSDTPSWTADGKVTRFNMAGFNTDEIKSIERYADSLSSALGFIEEQKDGKIYLRLESNDDDCDLFRQYMRNRRREKGLVK